MNAIQRISTEGQQMDNRAQAALIIDQNPLHATLARNLLERKLFQVQHLSTFIEKQDIKDSFTQETLDLIILDVDTHTDRGLETLATIAEYQLCPIIAIISDQSDSQACLSAGASAVLTKPLAAHTFYATLETLKETTREGDPVLEPIDAEALFDRVGGRMHILSKMVDLFIEELPGQLDALQQAIYKQNSEDLQRTAHALKGTVANFEAESACEIARKLEDMGHRRSHTGTRKLYHQLEKDLNLVKNALQNLITRA